MGSNPQQKRYDGLGLILRNAEKIEGFAASANPATPQHSSSDRAMSVDGGVGL